MFLLNVKMTSCSILEMQGCEWPETLIEIEDQFTHPLVLQRDFVIS